MATLPKFVEPVQPVHDLTPRPMLTLVHDASSYDELERTAPGVASRGLHRGVLGALAGLYALMVASFWTFFARDASAVMVMAFVTLIVAMLIGLIAGGVALADTPVPNERHRSFGAFLSGPVETLNDVITGRQAVIQILFLPAAMFVLATAIGIIARMTQAG